MLRSCLLLLLASLGSAVAFADEGPFVRLTSSEGVGTYRAGGAGGRLPTQNGVGDYRSPSNFIPLAQHPDKQRLLAAYLANFLDCAGRGPKQKQLAKKWAEQELRSDMNDGAWLMRLDYLDTDDGLTVVSAGSGRGAVAFSTESLSRIADSLCGAAVGFMRRSAKQHRIAIAFNGESHPRLWELNGKVLWSASADAPSVVRMLSLNGDKPMDSKLKNGASVLDVMLSDDGGWWVLSAEQRGNWTKPKNWIAAVGGHAERLSTLSANGYSSTGKLLQSLPVVSDVHLVSATLLPRAD